MMRLFLLLVVMAMPCLSYADSYDEARQKAQDALLKQSGIEDFQNKLAAYARNSVPPEAKTAGSVAWMAYKKKFVVPIYQQTKLTIQPGQAMLNVRVPF